MQDLINFYHSIPADTWTVLFGAAGVSVFTEIGKKLLKLENERVVQIFFVTVSLVASALQYLMSAHNIPPTILGLHTTVLLGLASQWYVHIIKPLSNAITRYKQFVENVNQQQETISEQKTNITPPQPPTFDV